MLKTLIVLLVVIVSNQAMAEKIYKWVDENGQIHYASKKPAGQEVEAIKLKKSYQKAPKKESDVKTEVTDKKQDQTAGSQMTEEEINAEAEAKALAKAALAKADKVNRKLECDMAKKNLTGLNASIRVMRTNDKGETVRMTDDERVEAMQSAQKSIKQNCN